MLYILMTFLLTTAAYAALLWLGLRRIVTNMKKNPAAQAAVTEHVIAPLFGEATAEETPVELKPEGKP